MPLDRDAGLSDRGPRDVAGDAGSAEAAAPDRPVADAGQDAAGPDAALPDAAQADGAPDDGALADAVVVDAAAPDSAMPDTASSDLGIVDSGDFDSAGLPPPNPVDLVAEGRYAENRLSFTIADLPQISCVVQRGSGDYPADHSQGVQVGPTLQTTGPQNVYDPAVPVEQPLFYAVFCTDGFSWNDTVTPGANADTATALPAWWDWDYGLRRRLTFDNTARGEDLDNVPVLVKLTPERIDYSATNAGGTDLRFIDRDGTTRLEHEIESWNPGAESVVWVRIPQLDGNSSADYVYMYYQNASPLDPPSATGVWSNGYTAVYHLNNGFSDATGGGHDGTGFPGASPPSPVGGVLGGAHAFDGSSQYVALAGEGDFDYVDSMSLLLWFRVQSFSITHQTLIAKGDDSWRLNRDDDTNFLEFGTTRVGGTHQWLSGGEPVNDGGWHFAAAVYDGNRKRLYVDNVVDGNVNYSESLNNSAFDVLLGENGEATGRYFHGALDEVRVSAVARSQDWVRLQYASMSDDLILYPLVDEELF